MWESYNFQPTEMENICQLAAPPLSLLQEQVYELASVVLCNIEREVN